MVGRGSVKSFRGWMSGRLMLLLILVLPSYTMAEGKVVVLVLGDSLSAGYGMAVEDSWVSLVNQQWQAENANGTLVNASQSGETTEGGLRRLPGLLEQYQPQVVVIELGGNDGLRGFQLDHTRKSLREIIERCQLAGARPLLVEILLPPNYGPRYTEQFRAIYHQLGQDRDTTLIPNFLELLVSSPELVQADGIHPTAEAQPIIANHMLPYLLDAMEMAMPLPKGPDGP